MPLTTAQAAYVDDFIRTGHTDAVLAPWPGNIIEIGEAAHHAVRSALVTEVRRRETSVRLPKLPPPPSSAP